jgi:UPF0716 family protein affecting phage T7 exclusion
MVFSAGILCMGAAAGSVLMPPGVTESVVGWLLVVAPVAGMS